MSAVAWSAAQGGTVTPATPKRGGNPGSSDGEIFAAIRQGTSADMDSYAERISAAETWHLVNYLKSLKP